MTPHDDGSMPSDASDARLQSLYRARKQRHGAPRPLNDAVLERARSRQPDRKTRSFWKPALPTAAAAAVVVLLGLQWLHPPMPVPRESARSLPAPKQATDTERSSSRAAPEANALSFMAEAPAPSQTPSAEPPQASAGAADLAPQTALSSRAAKPQAILADPVPSGDSHPRYLHRIDNDGGQARFERCDGQSVAWDPNPSTPGWFEVEWNKMGDVTGVTALPQSPCDEIKNEFRRPKNPTADR